MKGFISFTLIFIFVCFDVKAEQTCQASEALLGAHYRLVNSQINIVTKEPMNEHKNDKLSSLWRQNQKVLTVNDEQSITWYKLNNNLIQKIAHFDHFQRSIEYQAKSISDEHWQQIRQLIPDSKIQPLNLSASKSNGCYQEELYQWENESSNLRGSLRWNADLKLVIELTLTQGNQQSHWQLEKIELDEKVIESEFSKRANYQTTDFADIGDNESDPFLIKMINLGFIEHGSSGIYNTQGESIAIEHNH